MANDNEFQLSQSAEEAQKALNDILNADWIAKKTLIGGDTVIIPEQYVNTGWSNLQVDINVGIKYDVYISDTVYVCEAYNYNGIIVLGNYTIANSNAVVPHNNEPFYISWGGSATYGGFGRDTTLPSFVKVKVTDHAETVYNKMPAEYLPKDILVEEVLAQTTAAVKKYVDDALKDVKSAKIGYISLLADAWVGEGNLYSQIVTVDDVTENSQVDLTPDVEQLAVFYEKDLTFVTENDGGVVTVYAIGQKPQNDYTIQVTITEVA